MINDIRQIREAEYKLSPELLNTFINEPTTRAKSGIPVAK